MCDGIGLNAEEIARRVPHEGRQKLEGRMSAGGSSPIVNDALGRENGKEKRMRVENGGWREVTGGEE